MIAPPSTHVDDADTTYFSVCNARYFPGLVALLNSLRLTGHTGRLVVGDCGLTERQRARLRPHCTVFPIPRDLATPPTLFKPFPALLSPDGLVVILDSDLIVTGSLGGALDLARFGKICAYHDPESDRWFAAWQRELDLSGPPRRQTYVSAHFLALDAARWRPFLERWWAACEHIARRSVFSSGQLTQHAAQDGPLAQMDQDALNALLMSEVAADDLALLPGAERPILESSAVRVLDERTLTCSYRGQRTKLVHADGSRKPWEARAWWKVRDDAYTRLLRRLLLAGDLPLALSPSELPLWLQPRRRGRLTLRALSALNARTPLLYRAALIRPLGKQLVRRLGGLARAIRRPQRKGAPT